MNIAKAAVMTAAIVCSSSVFSPASSEISVTGLKGEAAVWDSSAGRWAPVSKDARIPEGSHIKTSRRSFLEARTPQKHKIRIDENTRVVIDEATESSSIISLTAGRLRSWVKKLKPADKYQVKTPISVISVRGTDFSLDVRDSKNVRLEVYEGIVEARDEAAGRDVSVRAGESLNMEAGVPAPAPEPLKSDGGDSGVLDAASAARAAARAEMFDEISRDAVMSRAAEELRSAEYQNGKALIDARGLRVRLEEYIVRPTDNQFKYVVLNTRENRFDFGKILFTFSGALPADLTLATRSMFEAAGATKPSLYLTGVDSVMSNTVDKVNEIASNCDMSPDDPISPSRWTMFPGSYEFYINGSKRWSFTDVNGDKKISAAELSYYDSAGAKIASPSSEFNMPSGPSVFHFYQKNIYADGVWIAAADYIVDDDGNILTLDNLKNKTSSELKDYAYKLNFQREYTSNAFTNASAKNSAGAITIDLVFSSKLLIDSGILSLPDPGRFSAPSY